MLGIEWTRMGIRAADRRKLLLMTPIFLICGIAEVLNYNGFMTLFNQRLGGAYLPYVYMAEAAIIPIEAWLLGTLAGRLSKPALMRFQFAAILLVVLANAAVLLALRGTGANYKYYYAILFLTSNFVVRQQTVMLWSLAVDVCPTQQAKRLMPVFVSGATLGGVCGGLITQFVSSLGMDIVYAIGPILLLSVAFSYNKAIVRYLVPLTLGKNGEEETQAAGASSWAYFTRTLRSPFLGSVLAMMSIMPALFILIEYLFVNTAHAHYPDEASYGRMFGIVSTLMFAMAFLIQLFSGKLMARLGASGMLVGISVVYAVFFAISFALFDTPLEMTAIAGSYMLMNVLVYYSAEPSYQLFYKVLPLQERDGYRFAAQGVASFLGIAAGVVLQLLHSALGWSFGALALSGACAAVAMLAISWALRQLYMKELLRSFLAFRPDEKDHTESIRELAGNPKAMAAIHGLLQDPREEARVIALEVLAAIGDSRYLSDMMEPIGDESARVRAAALRAVNLSRAGLSEMIKVASVLEDEEPAVRAEAVRKLTQMKHMPEQAFFFLRMKLLDPNPEVVAEAVRAMYRLESEKSYAACFEVIERILGEGGEPTVPILRVVAELSLKRFAPEATRLLNDSHPSVRVVATSCIGALGGGEALPLLLDCLPTADQELYRATIAAITDMGAGNVSLLRDRLADSEPRTWQAIIAVLAVLLPEEEVRGWLCEAVADKLTEVEASDAYPPIFKAAGRPELADLAELRHIELRKTALESVWSVLDRLTDERSVSAIRGAIEDEDEEIRGGGLEALAEGFGERRLSQRAAAFLQKEADWDKPLSEEEAWLAIAGLAQLRSDDWWREIAQNAEERRMGISEAPRALGRLDKVVYLKKVPFFSDLSLEELGLIAGASQEMAYEDGALLLRRGEQNEALHIVVEGNVELKSVSSAGWEATLGVVGSGEVCGATSALDGSPSTITAQAFFGEVRTLSLRREELTRLVRLYPEIGIGLLRASLARIRLLEEMMMRIDS